MIPFPSKKFSVIYADPPWTYNDKAMSGNRGACCKYPVMSIQDIKALPIESITNPDCLLFMWVTFPMLQEGLDTIRAWGFDYRTIAFNWIKKNKKNTETNFWGMGNWTRSNSEICLLGIKGKPKRQSAGVHSIVETFETETIESPIQEHSEKPSLVRERIVELCGDVPRIELFARQVVTGWSAWGNEVNQPKDKARFTRKLK